MVLSGSLFRHRSTEQDTTPYLKERHDSIG
jgi:hypothetical protein